MRNKALVQTQNPLRFVCAAQLNIIIALSKVSKANYSKRLRSRTLSQSLYNSYWHIPSNSQIEWLIRHIVCFCKGL